MRLLLSIPLALIGSMIGSALRGAVKVAEARLEADPDAPPPQITTTIIASPAAAIVGGALGVLFGPRTAFWSGMVLGAAGVERLDGRLLGLVGVDLDALVARASALEPDAAEAMDSESDTESPAEQT